MSFHMRITALAIGGLVFCAGVALGRVQDQEPELFVMMYTTGPGWDPALPPAQQPHFAQHSANLTRLRQDGRIVMGGRFGQWGLILVRAADEASAQALFAADSALVAGTFRGELQRWSTIYEGSVTRR
jgi:uncharacterized protein YciI